MALTNTPTSKVENRAQVSSCSLKFVHDTTNEECHAGNGKQSHCFRNSWKHHFNFLKSSIKVMIVYNRVFKEDSKMGPAIFVPGIDLKLL